MCVCVHVLVCVHVWVCVSVCAHAHAHVCACVPLSLTQLTLGSILAQGSIFISSQASLLWRWNSVPNPSSSSSFPAFSSCSSEKRSTGWLQPTLKESDHSHGQNRFAPRLCQGGLSSRQAKLPVGAEPSGFSTASNLSSCRQNLGHPHFLPRVPLKSLLQGRPAAAEGWTQNTFSKNEMFFVGGGYWMIDWFAKHILEQI